MLTTRRKLIRDTVFLIPRSSQIEQSGFVRLTSVAACWLLRCGAARKTFFSPHFLFRNSPHQLLEITVKPCLCVLAVCLMPFLSVAAEDTRVFEMRTYHANPGKLDALNSRFRDHTVNLFEKHGMTNVGYWVPKDNEKNLLIYVLAYPSQEARDASWKAFMNDADWKAAYAESTKDGKLVGKVDSVFLQATDYSPLIAPKLADESRLFELRIYSTNEGKLPNLNARFRDHTVKLFEKHGISNVAYWTPTREKDGKDQKLVYLVAHKDEASRKAAFAAFGADPEWQAARKASEEGGRLLIDKGIESVLMTPTDYSPTK